MNTKAAARVPSPVHAQETPHNVPAVISDDASALVQIIERAVRDPSVDIDKLQRLIEMRTQIQAKEAETAFDIGMTEAQRDTRAVVADSKNDQTRNSKYASYFALDAALRPIYTTQGFALSFNTEDCPLEQGVRVVCRVSHNGGHSRNYRLDMPADGKGARGGDVMTKTHATGSAVSYGMRYLLKMIFNIAVDADDDGNAAAGPQQRQTKSRVPSPNAPAEPTYAEPHAFKAKNAVEWTGAMLGYIAAAKSAAEIVAWDELNRDNLKLLANADAVRLKTVMNAMKAMKAKKAELEAGEPVTSDGELPAKSKTDGVPDAATDPEKFLAWADKALGAVKVLEALDPLYNSEIETRAGGLFPPDKDELVALHRKHELRLGGE